MIGSDDLYTAAHLFSPARLTLARELRGLTKTELASRIEKTAAAVGQFENARAKPDPRTLKRLALALGLPLAFFADPSSPPRIELDRCHFRSLRSASQRERRRLLARGTIVAELADFLDEHLEQTYRPNILSAEAPPKNRDEIEALAERMRGHWERGQGPIANMVRLLERNGVLVMRIADDCKRVDAFSFWHGQRPCVFLVMEKDSQSRTRFDAAHELGHLVMHEDVSPGDKQLEREANQFASAFLMPRASMLRELPTRLRWPHFVELKQRWKVSLAALVRRARDLGRITESTYRRACITLSKRRASGQPEPAEPEPEYPQYFEKAFAAAAMDFRDPAVASRLRLHPGEVISMIGDVVGTQQQLPLGLSGDGIPD